MLKKTLLSWSSGKDSAWALHVLRQQSEVEVVGLMTTVNQLYQRIAIHAVRLELLQRQAEAVGLPLQIIDLPYPCTNVQYEALMETFCAAARLLCATTTSPGFWPESPGRTRPPRFGPCRTSIALSRWLSSSKSIPNPEVNSSR